jgi:hypothetical protein
MPTKKVPKKVIQKKLKKTVKKPVVKKTVKKVAKNPTKKGAVRKVIKKPLVYAGNQESFWVTNGQILNSLLALKDALEEMEKEVYLYHAGTAQNDFAAWVEAVLSDKKCAKELQKARTPKSAKTVVIKHLKSYSV